MTRKRHSPDEIVGKLHQAHEMLEKGRRQGEIARALGISIMTYHRWRKARPDIVNGAGSAVRSRAPLLSPGPNQDVIQDIVRIDELRIENEQLRRLVANLLLEKIRLEDALQRRSSVDGRDSKPSH